MKRFFAIASMFIMSQLAFSQAWSGAGDQKVQAGISAWGNGTGITGTYDYGLSNLVSVGGGLNLYFDGGNDDDFFVFGRVNFHLQDFLNLPDKWDIYPGASVGILGNTFGLGVHLGARYYFTDKIGAFVEAGNNGSIGISINL